MSDEEKVNTACKSWYGELKDYKYAGPVKAYDTCGNVDDYSNLTNV